MNELQKLVAISKYAGARFDLVQAGGGNASVRLSDGTLLIKSSGISLSDVTEDHGYTRINMNKMSGLFSDPLIIAAVSEKHREELADQYIAEALLPPHAKPSMEICLHLLFHRYTLHTHPLALTNLLIRENAQTLAHTLFPDCLFIPYANPGISLAFRIAEGITMFRQKSNFLPKRVLLQNHGLIVSSDDPEEIRRITEDTIGIAERHFHLDYHHYKMTSAIMDVIQPVMGHHYICTLSEDEIINKALNDQPELIFAEPATPDQFVYNGFIPMKLTELSKKEIEAYYAEQQTFPKVIIYKNKLFFLNKTVRKTKEMEEVFKAHLLALTNGKPPACFLKTGDLEFLRDSGAEKYRQNL